MRRWFGVALLGAVLVVVALAVDQVTAGMAGTPAVVVGIALSGCVIAGLAAVVAGLVGVGVVAVRSR